MERNETSYFVDDSRVDGSDEAEVIGDFKERLRTIKSQFVDLMKEQEADDFQAELMANQKNVNPDKFVNQLLVDDF